MSGKLWDNYNATNAYDGYFTNENKQFCIEVGGNLGYDTMLIIRALTPNTRVQGDSGGTTIGLGGTTPYNSGELVVQTANAGFTLVYLGATDSQGTIVSSSVQGWWLKEV